MNPTAVPEAKKCPGCNIPLPKGSKYEYHDDGCKKLAEKKAKEAEKAAKKAAKEAKAAAKAPKKSKKVVESAPPLQTPPLPPALPPDVAEMKVRMEAAEKDAKEWGGSAKEFAELARKTALWNDRLSDTMKRYQSAYTLLLAHVKHIQNCGKCSGKTLCAEGAATVKTAREANLELKKIHGDVLEYLGIAGST